ncbi:hypothetical protein NXC14_CH01986 [Rhizobium sp. NXC14]|uniref:hypothetical protein n=1 Tax=Rhizobium sp. NXC14 TaxID=1981173 RepID=UPI000A2044E4|nr:hypothetical protein [Rhizobium sp. NXC14]ARO29936.1 hypothetical protein NXC14_CH01986 [Rhizobium sp. NXC14]
MSSLQDHTNENLPSDLKVSRKGGQLVLQTRTATIYLDFSRRAELVEAIKSLG